MRKKKSCCPGDDIKLLLMERLHFWRSGKWGVHLAITPRSTHTQHGSTCLNNMDQIDLFKKYLYLIELGAKKTS